MSKISLNNEVSIDITKLIQSRAVILANSGGGKSYAIRKIAEEAVKSVQVIIIDPEGEFASLREKYDFILAGKGADVPVEVRSAALLATKLLELGKSAVIDLYELHPSERQRYVKLFCESMVNCPKELYHPVIVILDEAHEYVPEGKPSEATWAVEALASKGRKRGQCLIPASQRIAKLSKNVSAECNNKLIGRASQDIDMKRAGDELGFGKDKLIQLRQLKPGEFFAFGPAISDEVIKLKIGEVKTSHAKVSYKGGSKVPSPSHVIKKVLGELADLPQEAEKEAKTVAELRAEIKKLKTEHHFKVSTEYKPDQKLIDKAISDTEKRKDIEFMAERDEFLKHINTMFQVIAEVAKTVKDIKMPDLKIRKQKTQEYKALIGVDMAQEGAKDKNIQVVFEKKSNNTLEMIDSREIKPLRAGAMKMLNWLAGADSLTKQRLATLSGFAVTGGTFNTYISELKRNGWITGSDIFSITQSGHSVATPETIPSGDELIILWKSKFRLGAGNILQFVYAEQTVTKEDIGKTLNFEITGGTFNTYLSELRRNGLINIEGDIVSISGDLIN